MRARGGAYLEVLEHAQPPIPPGSRLAARFALMRAFHYAQTGQLSEAVSAALALRRPSRNSGSSVTSGARRWR